VNRRLALPLAVSIALHAGLVAALILLVGNVPLAPLPTPEPQGIEITLAPSEPIPPPPIPDLPPPPPPIPDLPPPPPPIPELPPLPPPPVAVEAPPPPPPPRVVHREVLRPPRRPLPQPERQEQQAPPVQTTAAPRPVAPPARPVISASYRAALSAWLQEHKQYPESARARSEEGQVLLRFHVARSGRLINFAVVRSSGYPDLDAAVDAMMRGAVLPAFPGDMIANDIEVTVAVQFSLSR
jgi:protein TonB